MQALHRPPSPPAWPAQWFVFGGRGLRHHCHPRRSSRDLPRPAASVPVAPWAGAYGRDRDPGTIPLLPDDRPDLSPAFLTDLSFPSVARVRTAGAI
jgi:hypothetical protein